MTSKPTPSSDHIGLHQAERLFRVSFNSHSILIMIGALIAIAVVSAAVFLGVLLPNNLRTAAISNQLQAQQAAALIDFSFNNIQQRVVFLATQPSAQTALSSKDPAAIASITTQMTQSFPEATLALAVPLGMSDTPEFGQAIGFAPVDLVRRSEQNQAAAPEASKKGDVWVVYFVAPVNDISGARTGTLLIGIETQALKKIWSGLGSFGKYSLLQKDNLIITQGEGGGGKAEQVKLTYADLTAQFQSSGNEQKASFGSLLFIIAVLVAVMINVAAIFVGEVRLQKEMREDAAHLLKFIHALLSEKPMRMPAIKNPLFSSVAHSVDHYAKLLTKNKTTKIAAAAVAKAKTATPIAAPQNPTVEVAELSATTTETMDSSQDQAEPVIETDAPDEELTSTADQRQEEEDLDIDLINELDDLFGNVKESTNQPTEKNNLLDIDALSSNSATTAAAKVSRDIFRAYDIRGIVGETLTDEVVNLIGLAIGTEAITRGERTIMVGYDGRLSSPQLNAVLCKAITKTGCQVISIGQVSTPVLYYATSIHDTHSGVMITGSHNPPNYNGFKIVLAGKTLSGEDIQEIYDRIQKHQFASGDASITNVTDITDHYIKHIIKEIKLERRLKVVVDCGNGAAGLTAQQTLEGINCEVVPLFCDVDGNFPNHHPDPSNPKNLVHLIDKVKSESADIGIAFDGDGDRLGIVTNTGKIIHADRVLAILAKSVLARKSGSIIFDVKCSRVLPQIIRDAGGVPIMWKTGHSFIKAKLKETGALLAGEMSGHIFFSDRWFGFDDGLYSATRLLEVLAQRQISSQELFDSLPKTISTPEINVPVSENKKFSIIDSLLEHSAFTEGKITTLDGVRVDYPNGWGLVRASNTTPCLVLRFEADTQEELARIKALFKEKLLAVDSNLSLTF